MDFKSYENFIMNKARDLEVSLFNYYVLNDNIEDCLLALSLYVNEDGGISNIDPFNNNTNSTLPATLYFLDLLTKIEYKNDVSFFNDILKEIIKYLRKQSNFSFYSKTNNKLECSDLYMSDEYLFELEALSYAYISYFSKFKDNDDKLKQLINKFIELDNVTFNQVLCFKKISHLIENKDLNEKIIKSTSNFLNKINELILTDNDYLFNNYPNEIKKCLDELLLKQENGLWHRVQLSNNMKEEVANIKYLSIDIINNLLFISRVGELLEI